MDKSPFRGQLVCMAHRTPRLAARALILHEDRLLLVNAYPGKRSDLWCAPGGGARTGKSLPDNLIREVHEETGLIVSVGPPCLINEFHDPQTGFHQVDLFFRCSIAQGELSADWRDPERVVTDRRFFTRSELEMGRIRFKPDSLPSAAWGAAVIYDPLEVIVR
jgi:8-oxo-dGTP pyrophosphatase MutT (NUDIX family)